MFILHYKRWLKFNECTVTIKSQMKTESLMKQRWHKSTFYLLYKLHLIFHVATATHFSPTVNQFFHSVNEECWWSFHDLWPHCILQFIYMEKWARFISLFNNGKKWRSEGSKSSEYGGRRIGFNFNFTKAFGRCM